LLGFPTGFWCSLPVQAGPTPAPQRIPLRVTNSVPGPSVAAAQELSVETLVEQVIARNPSLPEAVAAWEAARARYPQVTSLDDPLFGTTLAPAAVGREPDNGYRFEV